MISPELIRRYPFFANFTHDELTKLANVADELQVEAGDVFLHENEELEKLYFLLEGAVGVIFEVPANGIEQSLSGQFTGRLQTEEAVISAIGPGEVFGWSSLVPPYQASAGVKALTPTHVLAFDAPKLRTMFEQDCHFGYLMILKLAQVIRGRLRDLRIESLAAMT